MKYVEYGLKQNKTIMLLHGGGLAPWNYSEEAEQLQDRYHSALILVGSKESGIMKKSAKLLCEKIPRSTLEMLPGYYHGDLSLNHASEYVQKIEKYISK